MGKLHIVLVRLLRIAEKQMHALLEWVESIRKIPMECSFPPILRAIFNENDEWWDAQSKLAAVERWKNYRGGNHGPIFTRQSSLTHSYGIVNLGHDMVTRLLPYQAAHEVDVVLVLQALQCHDQAERALGDTLYNWKTAAGDAREVEEFWRQTERRHKNVRAQWMVAFLLQFALKPTFFDFSSDAQEILKNLARTRRIEALLFQAVENWDYLQKVLWEFRHSGNAEAFVRIMRQVVPHFAELAEELPGFQEEFWSGEFKRWCLGIVACHEGEWLDKV